jgi:hypothetical protein
LEKQAVGEGLNAWGARLNTVIDLTEEALSGVLTKSLTGNATLTSTNYASDEARHMVLVFTDGGLSANATVTIPDVEKVYIVRNAGATYDVILTAGGATNATVKPGEIRLVYCDGATAVRVETNADLTTVAGIAADVSAVAAIDTDVTAVAAIDANVTTVAGISANVTTVAGISANVTSVAGNATNINTVAGISADVTTVAGDSAAVQAVAADAADIGTVATNIANVNKVAAVDTSVSTVAGISANVTTVAGISANVTTVAGVSANVTTVAGIAADVTAVAGISSADLAAVAAIDTQVGTVAGISADVTTVAGIAADVTFVATNGVVPGNRTLTAGTGLTGGGDLTANRTFAVDVASDANVRAGTANKILDAAVLVSAAAPVSLADGANIAVDMNAGRVFTVTLGGNRTLDNPTNQTAGESGIFIVKQDATGNRTLSYGSNYKFAGGAPTLSTAANAIDVISYYVEADGTILCTFVGEFA